MRSPGVTSASIPWQLLRLRHAARHRPPQSIRSGGADGLRRPLRARRCTEDFLSFTLRFVCDGRTLKTLRFDYGDSFDFSVFPSLTEQSGSYPVWDRTDLTDLRFDTVAAPAEYTAYRASSRATRSARMAAAFSSSRASSTNGHAHRRRADARSQHVPQLADNRRTTLENYFSFLSDRTLPAITVYRSVAEQWRTPAARRAGRAHAPLSPAQRGEHGSPLSSSPSNGTWQPVETTSVGSYLLFTAEGENVQLAVLTTAAVWWLWAIFIMLRMHHGDPPARPLRPPQARKKVGAKQKKKTEQPAEATLLLVVGRKLCYTIERV